MRGQDLSRPGVSPFPSAVPIYLEGDPSTQHQLKTVYRDSNRVFSRVTASVRQTRHTPAADLQTLIATVVATGDSNPCLPSAKRFLTAVATYVMLSQHQDIGNRNNGRQ